MRTPIYIPTIFFPTIEEDSSNLLTKHMDHYQPNNRFFFGANIQGTTLFSKHVLLSYLLSMISFSYTSLYSQLTIMVTPGCFTGTITAFASPQFSQGDIYDHQIVTVHYIKNGYQNLQDISSKRALVF